MNDLFDTSKEHEKSRVNLNFRSFNYCTRDLLEHKITENHYR